jgi:hypothetical protein
VREKFINRDLKVRRPADKKTSLKNLLDRVTTEPNLRDHVEIEARQLTDIGNNFSSATLRSQNFPLRPRIKSIISSIDFFPLFLVGPLLGPFCNPVNKVLDECCLSPLFPAMQEFLCHSSAASHPRRNRKQSSPDSQGKSESSFCIVPRQNSTLARHLPNQ